MSTSALSGSGSVIDVRGIVDQLMQLEARPLTVARSRVSAATVSISALSEVKSLVDTLGSSAKAMEDSMMLAGRSITSSDATLATASVTTASSATTGTFVVSSTSLAKAQRTTFAGFGSTTSALLSSGSATLTIDSLSTAFSDPPPAQQVFTLSGQTLEQLRDEINSNAALSGMITASIISTGDQSSGGLGYVLVLTGSKTGSTANFTATWDDTGASYATGSLVTGRSGVASSPTQGVSQIPLNQDAADAVATVDGIEVRSTTNTFSEAIGGVSFELLRSGASTNLTIADNKNTLKERLRTFAKDFSALNVKLNALTLPGSEGQKAGPLSGNSGVLSLGLSLSSAYGAGFLITGATGNGRSYTWADLGLERQRDGSITIRESDLTAAIDTITYGSGSARRIGEEMLGGFTSGAVAAQGFSGIRAALDQFRGASGTLQGGLDVLQTSKTRLDSGVKDLELRLERTRKNLLSKYAALDAKLASMSQLSANLRSSLANLQG